jgi:hypothetical protein
VRSTLTANCRRCTALIRARTSSRACLPDDEAPSRPPTTGARHLEISHAGNSSLTLRGREIT